jgi:hypothetical protein
MERAKRPIVCLQDPRGSFDGLSVKLVNWGLRQMQQSIRAAVMRVSAAIGCSATIGMLFMANAAAASDCPGKLMRLVRRALLQSIPKAGPASGFSTISSTTS